MQTKKHHKKLLITISILCLLFSAAAIAATTFITTSPKENIYDLGTYEIKWSEFDRDRLDLHDSTFESLEDLIEKNEIVTNFVNNDTDITDGCDVAFTDLNPKVYFYPVASADDLLIRDGKVEVVGKLQTLKFENYFCEFTWRYIPSIN
jgi:hypothetical protein